MSAGCVAPLCSMLSVQDSRMVIVTLEGLENILRVGSKSPTPDGVNPYAKIIEEAYGKVLCMCVCVCLSRANTPSMQREC